MLALDSPIQPAYRCNTCHLPMRGLWAQGRQNLRERAWVQSQKISACASVPFLVRITLRGVTMSTFAVRNYGRTIVRGLLLVIAGVLSLGWLQASQVKAAGFFDGKAVFWADWPDGTE